jgi:hypothetical protein
VRIFGPGGYNGARPDRQVTRNWNPMLDGPNSATVPDLWPLRARGADLERNDPIAASAIETSATSIVGMGIVPHSRVNREYLGLDDEAPATRSIARSTSSSRARRIEGVGSRGPERFLRPTGPRAARGAEPRRRDRRPSLHRTARRRPRDAVPADRRRSAVDAVDAVRQ